MLKTLKNLSYTLFSNIIGLLISMVVTFLVPKALGAESYGYFQLYIFYASYTGFLHFGWADGIFLRYGGAYYEKLDKAKFSGQFWLYSIIETALGLAITLSTAFLAFPQEKLLVIALVGISVLFFLPRTLLQYILQGTNRIKEYALITIIEKTVYLALVCASLAAGSRSFSLLILADLVGKACALAYSAWQCRDILSTRPEPCPLVLRESRSNISVGVKLMFANIASSLIIGIVRLAIERQWDVATFGKVSFTMTVSNLLMVFINAVALIMFPILRRANQQKLAPLYEKMRTCLMLPLLGMLVIYYPLKTVLSLWLPHYAESLKYMAVLFPMCLFESKMGMLVGTYLKTLRKESWLMRVNLGTVALSVLLTAATCFWWHNLDLAVFSIVALLAVRCLWAELLLAGSLQVKVQKDILLEIALAAVFIASNWFIAGALSAAIYLTAYLVYVWIKRDAVKKLFLQVKYLYKNRGI